MCLVWWLPIVFTCILDPREQTCLEEPDYGFIEWCRGYFPMYYYDPKTQTCKEFIYGGCGGNNNRYDTEEECLEYCRGNVFFLY